MHSFFGYQQNPLNNLGCLGKSWVQRLERSLKASKVNKFNVSQVIRSKNMYKTCIENILLITSFITSKEPWLSKSDIQR